MACHSPANSDCVLKVFLERSGARVISSDTLQPPKPDCPVCSAVYGRVTIDPERATVRDLVEGVLQRELGYGTELSVIKDKVIYDPDMEDMLPKKLSELGNKDEPFVTVLDQDDEDKDPRVTLHLEVVNR